MNIEKPEFLSEMQAAQMLGLAPGTLAVWRCTGRYRMPYIKCGRLIRYKADDLRKWADAQRRTGVSAGSEGDGK